jgi:ABC-type bacteriocin/lantibiotic exporter with double-glycine peptidase domain
VTEQKSLKNIFKNTFWTLRLIFRYNPQIFSAIALFQLLTASTPFIRNRLFSQLLDSLIYHQQNELLKIFSLFIIFLILATIFSFCQNQLTRILDTKLQSQLRTLFIGKVSQLDYQHLESKEIGNLISKVDEEFGWRMRQSVQDVSNVFANIISLITVTIIIFPKYPLLWLLIFVSQIPQYLIERYWVQQDWKLREANSDKNKLMWDLNYQLRTKNFISELRINNAVQYLFQKFKDSFDFFTNSRVSLRVRQSPSEIAIILLSIGVNGTCLYILLNDANNNLLTIGMFTFFFQTIQQTSDFFRGLVYSSVSITENSYHIGNFRKIIRLKNIILVNKNSQKIFLPK